MAEADLDIFIRQIAKAQNKSLMAAVKKRRDQIMARAAKAKDKDAKDQLKHLAKSAMLHGAASFQVVATPTSGWLICSSVSPIE